MQISRIEDLTVVIQAGGESKRMGTSKALVSFLGEPMIMRGVRRLFPICGEMVITTNEPQKMGFLEPYIQTGRMKLASDPSDRRGALVGMNTALRNASLPYVAMVACDMVFPSPEVFTLLYRLVSEGDYDAAIPKTGFGWEPFHAVYRRQTCFAMAKSALEAGEIKATSWIGDAKVRMVTVEELDEVNPSGLEFVNVNTPGELEATEKRILEEGLE